MGSRTDRISGDSGALTGRELLRRSGVGRFLAKRLPDRRDARRIRHSQNHLVRTLLLLVGQGRRDHSDAGRLGDDPALRLATTTVRARLRWAGAGACPRSRRCRGGWRSGRPRRASRCCARDSSA